MWGKGKGPQGAKSVRSSTETTLISAGTSIVGDIQFCGDLHLEGTIKGDICADEGRLCVAETGVVEGEIRAPQVVLNGTVKGNVIASEQLDLKSKAVITGNVYYHLLEMASGAQVNGSLEYRQGEPAKHLPAPEVVESEAIEVAP